MKNNLLLYRFLRLKELYNLFYLSVRCGYETAKNFGTVPKFLAYEKNIFKDNKFLIINSDYYLDCLGNILDHNLFYIHKNENKDYIKTMFVLDVLLNKKTITLNEKSIYRHCLYWHKRYVATIGFSNSLKELERLDKVVFYYIQHNSSMFNYAFDGFVYNKIYSNKKININESFVWLKHDNKSWNDFYYFDEDDKLVNVKNNNIFYLRDIIRPKDIYFEYNTNSEDMICNI